MGVTPRTFAPYVSGSPEHSFRRRHRRRFRGAEQASSPLSVGARLFTVRHRLPSKSLASPFRAFRGYAPHRRVLSPGRRSGQTGSACRQAGSSPRQPRCSSPMGPNPTDRICEALKPRSPALTVCGLAARKLKGLSRSPSFRGNPRNAETPMFPRCGCFHWVEHRDCLRRRGF